MFTKDYFLHSTYPITHKKVAIRKTDIASYAEEVRGTILMTFSEDKIIISMTYDDVKKELTETFC